jgi:hypothetical protein
MKSYKFKDFIQQKNENILDKTKMIVRKFPLTIGASLAGAGALGTAELAKKGMLDQMFSSVPVHDEPEQKLKPGLPPLKPAKPAKIIKRIEDAGRV